MPKSKHRKNHKQKVAARNQRIQNEKKSFEKKQREFIMQLIEKEKARGLFDSNNQLTPDFQLPDSINNDSPIISGPII